jgi:hypothetical protein
MYVDPQVINAAAQLVNDMLGDTPVDDETEHRGFEEDDAQALQDILDEVTIADLYQAMKAAADRLPEPTDEQAEES